MKSMVKYAEIRILSTINILEINAYQKLSAPAPWLVLLEQVVPMIDLLSPDLVPGTPAHVPATARISAADKMTKF